MGYPPSSLGTDQPIFISSVTEFSSGVVIRLPESSIIGLPGGEGTPISSTVLMTLGRNGRYALSDICNFFCIHAFGEILPFTLLTKIILATPATLFEPPPKLNVSMIA